MFEIIIKSGEKYANATGSISTLMYKWYDTEYMRAAHNV
jgi:hypothetical protein